MNNSTLAIISAKENAWLERTKTDVDLSENILDIIKYGYKPVKYDAYAL